MSKYKNIKTTVKGAEHYNAIWAMLATFKKTRLTSEQMLKLARDVIYVAIAEQGGTSSE